MCGPDAKTTLSPNTHVHTHTTQIVLIYTGGAFAMRADTFSPDFLTFYINMLRWNIVFSNHFTRVSYFLFYVVQYYARIIANTHTHTQSV